MTPSSVPRAPRGSAQRGDRDGVRAPSTSSPFHGARLGTASRSASTAPSPVLVHGHAWSSRPALRVVPGCGRRTLRPRRPLTRGPSAVDSAPSRGVPWESQLDRVVAPRGGHVQGEVLARPGVSRDPGTLACPSIQRAGGGRPPTPQSAHPHSSDGPEWSHGHPRASDVQATRMTSSSPSRHHREGDLSRRS